MGDEGVRFGFRWRRRRGGVRQVLAQWLLVLCLPGLAAFAQEPVPEGAAGRLQLLARNRALGLRALGHAPGPAPPMDALGGMSAARCRFQAEVLTETLETEIDPEPGTQTLDFLLRVRVQSSAPGWQMRIKSTHLENEDGARIRHEEMKLVPQDGALLPLNAFQPVVHEGPAGEAEYAVELAVEVEDWLECTTFSGELFLGVQHPQAPRSPLQKIPVTLTVRCGCTHQIEDNKMYFHFGGLPATQTATANGEVSADVPVQLRLRAVEGRIDELPLLRAYGDEAPDARIPLDWQLAESGQLRRPPDTACSDEEVAAWLLQGTPGAVSYELDLSLAPTPYQAAGDYGMAVEVTLQPVL